MTPLGPLGARPYRFEQKYCLNRLCENAHKAGTLCICIFIELSMPSYDVFWMNIQAKIIILLQVKK